MYPTLSDLTQDLFGFRIPLPIQTFGFFVVLSVLGAAYFLGLELKRREKEGILTPAIQKIQKNAPVTNKDVLWAALLGFIIGFKLLYIFGHYKAFLDAPQPYILSTDGNFAGGLIGALIGAAWKLYERQKQKNKKAEWENVVVHPYQLVSNMAMLAAFSGLLGAKIFHNLENLDEFMRDPIDALLSFSGLTFYGGLLFGAVTVIWYARKNGIPTLQIIDAAAPGLMLAYGIGRIGCQMSGDGDWGITNTAPKPSWLSAFPDWVWSYTYPHNVISEGVPIEGCLGKHCTVLSTPVYPTPLYESVICILLFGVIWALRKKFPKPGMLFCFYLVLNGIERFFIEKIRVNTEYPIFGGTTQAEIISSILIVAGLAGLFYFYKKKAAEKTL